MKMNVRSLKSICGCGLLALAIGGCSEKKVPEPVVKVQTAVAKRAPIDLMVNAEGVLYPLHEADLTPKVSAPVEKFYVNLGAKVRKGQLLATLQNSDIAAAALENQGVYEQAQANYQSAVSAGVPEEMQKAQADATQAQQAYEAAEKVYKSREALYKQGAIARKDLDQAQVAATEAKGNYELARKHLAALQAGGEERKLKAAQGELTSAKGRYMGAAAQLAYTQIRSPIDGVVTDRPLYPGSPPPTGAPLITVMDLSQIIARLHLAQDQAALVKVGDEAAITVPGLKEPVAARVTMVNQAVDPNSTTVEVWVEAPNKDEKLRPGTSAKVAITAQHVPDAVVVPAGAVFKSEDGGTFVMVVGSDGKAHETDVRIGVRGSHEVQVSSGIDAGAQVVTQGGYGLPDGTKVDVENPQAAESPAKQSKKSGGADEQ